MYYYVSPEEVEDLRDSIFDTYSEHLEMLGDKSPSGMITILCGLLLKERKHNEYQSKLLRSRKNERANSAN
jgi:hypothetical protein